MKRNLIFLLCLLISSCQAQRQTNIEAPGYNIKVEVEHLKNQTIYLANNLGDKMYYTDTALVDINGHAQFIGDSSLSTGKYSIVFPNFKFLQIIIDEQNFTIQTDTTDYYKTAKAINSVNNEAYFDYFRIVQDLNIEKSGLLTEKNDTSTSPARLTEIESNLISIEEGVKEMLHKEYKDHKGTFYSKVIAMGIPIDVPEAPFDANGKVIDEQFRYNYFKNHYFDFTDLSEPNIFRTPEYYNKLNDYFNKVIPQVPDSMPAEVDRFLPKVNHDPELYSYTLRFLAANFKRSKYMGMEIGYVHVINNYFNEETIIGLEPDRLKDAMEEAKDMTHTLLGNIAPNINLHDATEQKYTKLHDVKAPYTLVYIWSPTCSHCLEENPDVIDFNNQFRSMGVKTYAVCADQELEEWKKYLNENYEFALSINVADSPGHRSKFRNLYNTRKTPVVLLLDKDKTILTKRLSVKQVGDFLNKLLKEPGN
ncbi:MAG: thiol-disulfide isomerase/thioredoxin [Patiriisocius sp.]|jgi:thiol-disulfide isomerase/thioredoxin